MELIAEEYIHEVIPSPGTEDKEWPAIEKKLDIIKGVARSVHIDIIDGKFASNVTFLDPKPFAKYATDFFLEVHLMVDNPIQYLKPFADAGFKRFMGHIEKMPDVDEFVAQGQMYGEVGLAIDAGTDVDALKVNFDDIDCVLVMTVKAGFSGQQFMESQLETVRKLREKTMVPIEVDGGVRDTTLLFTKNMGANRFVATSFIWNSQDPKVAYDQLTKIATS